MKKIVLRGEGVSKGVAEGEALVTRDYIVFTKVDSETGIVMEKSHELEGQCIRDRILVFPGSKGSSETALRLYQMSESGTSPAAIINIRTEGILAVGAVLGNIPCVHKLEKNPISIIETGDFVKVNANSGTIDVIKKDS